MLMSTSVVCAQEPQRPDSLQTEELNEVVFSARRLGVTRLSGALNGQSISRDELFKAACCNLGESFVTNPSVDVSYSDAATGAKQIKLLGLSGTYVQMLTENLPNFRIASLPYALGYVPGPWMKSIQVSKGNSSVKNGYEAMTGQINIEYLKPDDTQGLTVNLYGNTKSKFEANADANLHLSENLSGEVLSHYEDDFAHHDDNHDGFIDLPKINQKHLMTRWKWTSGNYMLHIGGSVLNEDRESGQIGGHHFVSSAMPGMERYEIGVETDRYEGYMKHAVILNAEHGSNIALMANATLHQLNASYGHKQYRANQKTAYAQLMFESDLTPLHNISVGTNISHDYLDQWLQEKSIEKETVFGAYAQYTLNLNEKLVAMAGIRADHSSVYGSFVTPRVHVKFMPTEIFSLRISAGKGYRTPHALAENHFLLSSGRTLQIDELEQEEAWNYGINASLNIPLFGETLRLNAEYYYTDFNSQMITDYESDMHQIRLTNLDGDSYSHTFQVDATYPLFRGMTLTAAYRMNDVKTTYNHRLMTRPLTSKYKGLLSASYKTPLGLWEFDATLQLNGGGHLPTPYTLADGTPSWNATFHGYEQLSAQITRWFRHFSVYIGGENLTGFRQKNPIFAADNPWGSDFEPTLAWGPVHGAMFYAGLRVNFGRL
ncbi:MAG: TonB-dependent receptor [Bacteroidaceae bacterium]|nr:TonB-dependent receptor [Bacteroidaceae bacterium]